MYPDITIMNFTGIYENETFYHRACIHWVDCRHLYGTDCYCDNDGQRQLRSKISGLSAKGIHFIDSGNYHYMTKLWTDMLDEPFTLVLIDHHTDMQPSLFKELLSCGCWVNHLLDENPMVQKAVLLGMDPELAEQIPEKYRQKIAVYNETDVILKNAWIEFCKTHIHTPVYLSIDKDILNARQLHTNWNQGRLTIAQLRELIQVICTCNDILGIDICGECPKFFNGMMNREILEDDTVNKLLLDSFVRIF